MLEATDQKTFLGFKLKLGLIMFFSTLFPIVLLGSFSLNLTSKAFTDLIVSKHQADLNAVSGGIELFLDSQLKNIQTLAEEPTFAKLAPNDIKTLGLDLLLKNTFFREILVVDQDLTVRGVAGRHSGKSLESMLGKPINSIADPRIQEAVPHLVKTAIADSRLLSASGKIQTLYKSGSLAFIIPIPGFTDPSQIRGFCVGLAVLDGVQIQDILNTLSNNNDYTCILAKSGEILARKGKGLKSSAVKIELPVDKLELAESSGHIQTLQIENDQQTDLLSISFSRYLGGYIAIGQPLESALKRLKDIQETFFVTFLLAIVIAAVGSYITTQLVAKPVQSLIEGLKTIETGVFSHRIEYTGSDELAQAAKAANSLAQSLQKKALISEAWEKIRCEKEESR